MMLHTIMDGKKLIKSKNVKKSVHLTQVSSVPNHGKCEENSTHLDIWTALTLSVSVKKNEFLKI